MPLKTKKLSNIKQLKSQKIHKVSAVREKSLCGKGIIVERVLSLQWKSEGVMEDENGDNEDDEMTCLKRDESEGDWTSRGWRNESCTS